MKEEIAELVEKASWREILLKSCKELGIKRKDVAVLGVSRDPFLVGNERQLQMAKWFKNIIDTYYPNVTRLHLRRVHYHISQKVKLKDIDGRGYYLNDYKHWVKFSMASLIARYLGFVDCDIFIDKRNPDTQDFSFYYPHTTIEEACKNLPEQIVNNVSMAIWNSHLVQPYHLEIWVEKSTMHDILIPLCSQYRISLVTGLGELSLTKVKPELFNRLRNAGRPARIFYVSDFDPAGNRMPRSIARKIEWFNRLMTDEGLDIKLKHIILTEDMVKELQLPKSPIKAKTARATTVYKRKFEEKYGQGAVELDALEALYPGKFEEIVKSHILQYFDIDAHNAIVRENRRITDFIKPIVAEHLKTLVLPSYESAFEFPESELEVDESDDKSWLYDSTLDYSGQLARYKSLYKEEEDEDGED